MIPPDVILILVLFFIGLVGIELLLSFFYDDDMQRKRRPR